MAEINKPEKLYHFTKIETAIRFILPNKYLLLNSLINMNDPKENLLHETNIGEGFKFFTYIDDYTLAKKIQNETKVLCFSIDRQIEIENKLFKIKGYELQRMWAQYGGNNTGVALVIDYEKFIKENQEIIIENEIIDDEVVYDYFGFQILPKKLYGKSQPNKYPNLKTVLADESHWNALKSSPEFVKRRFFTKNIDWQGEAEYRFLTFKKQIDDNELSIANSLEKVILGINSSRHFLPAIIDKIDREKVFYLDLDSDGHYELKIIK